MILKELEEKKILCKILTTDYLMFNHPKVLRNLASLKNIELRMYCTDNDKNGFHTKGYIFEKEEMYHIIIGSSKKKEDISNSTKYEDQFINNQIFSWMTRSKVSMDSPEARVIINQKENHLKIFLFIKKSDGEGSDFCYMGKVNPVQWQQTEIENDKGEKLPIMNFYMKLENGVREDIYEYFTS